MIVRTSLAVLLVLLCGCASAIEGTGTGTRPSSAAPSSPAPSTGRSTASSTASSTAPPPSSSAPVSVPPPAECGSGCDPVATADLDEQYAASLSNATGGDGVSSAAVLGLTNQGVPVFWKVYADSIAGDLVCSPSPVPNCVAVFGAGAHASAAIGFTRQGDTLVEYGDVPSDTPSTDGADLNGDGLIDVVTAINTYEPSYATGTVYWQTFQSTGTAFESTGCTPPAHRLPAEPTAPLTGTCPD